MQYALKLTYGKNDVAELSVVDALCEQVLQIAEDAKILTAYSGRGMYGLCAKLAIDTTVAPQSPAGQQLLALGAKWDNLGLGFVYYWER